MFYKVFKKSYKDWDFFFLIGCLEVKVKKLSMRNVEVIKGIWEFIFSLLIRYIFFG